MTAVFVIIFILVVIGAIAGPVVFLHSRRTLREQKNYERGLKMVPMLIHLPPPSEDMQANGRDQRDITDEAISKAQILYNIISSTFTKGFKAKFYGQRHFAFEIVGTHGFVYFYAAVPVAMVDVVQQAITSAYPSARLEEVAEHNIFNAVGRLNSTVGGEMVLKSSYAYPIGTFQDLKRDALVSLLNALSTLDKEDGAGIQLLLRPADPSWRKKASEIASKKRKGKDSKGGAAVVGTGLKQFVTAFAKPPEPGKEDEKPPKELSALEQQILDSIDDKTRHPGYEVMIRVVASSNISQRSQAILNNIVATFSLYDAPGKNGFKYIPAKDMESFVTSYILRFFPQKKNKNILNAVELATLFHFPDQQNTPTSQVTRQMSKQVDGPRNMPDEGLLLGYNVFRGVKKPVRLGLGDRQRHMYAVGQTGTGKSTFLENLALQDMLNGDGFAFIDPHGDTAEKLLAMVPKERTEDVIYFSPADMAYPMGLNLFEFHNPDQKDFLIQETLNMLYKLYDPQHQGIMGPRYEHLFRMAALTVMADPEGGTFVDIPKLFNDEQYMRQKLKYVTDQNVLDFWNKEIPQSKRSNDFGEVVSWFVSKFGAFLSNEMMRNIIGQTKSAFDLRDIMDNKKILIVNLSKGRTGDLNSKLLGMIFVMKFQAAAMSRASIPENERVDFCLYVDEFQNFSTDSFATIMSEARKYRLNLIVANQFTTQLTDEIRDAVFGNMGTIVSFRVGQNDVEGLAKYFQPAFDADDLLRVPNYNAIVRTLIGGVPTNPFSLVALPPLGNPNPKLAEALKQLSGAKYGKPRAAVEKEVFARLATKEEPKPAFGSGGGFGQSRPGGFGVRPGGFGSPAASPSPFGPPSASAGAGGFGQTSRPPAAPQSPAGGSFLDDWMAKRQQLPPATAQRAAQPLAAAAPFGSAQAAPAPQPFSSPAPGPGPAVATPPPIAAPATPPSWTPPKHNSHYVAQSPLDPVPVHEEPSADNDDEDVPVGMSSRGKPSADREKEEIAEAESVADSAPASTLEEEVSILSHKLKESGGAPDDSPAALKPESPVSAAAPVADSVFDEKALEAATEHLQEESAPAPVMRPEEPTAGDTDEVTELSAQSDLPVEPAQAEASDKTASASDSQSESEQESPEKDSRLHKKKRSDKSGKGKKDEAVSTKAIEEPQADVVEGDQDEEVVAADSESSATPENVDKPTGGKVLGDDTDLEELKLPRVRATVQQDTSPEDTIYIDKDGNLHTKAPDES